LENCERAFSKQQKNAISSCVPAKTGFIVHGVILRDPGRKHLSSLKAVISLLALGLALSITASSQRPMVDSAAAIALGKRLFKDQRFSSPAGDLANSCSSCHLSDEDPQGFRIHTDFFNRSWVPWRREDPRRMELRNSPTILDSASMPRLHFDGEFASLEALVKGTLTGRPMGWLPSEADRAMDHVRSVILNDQPAGKAAGSSYREQFKRTYGVDVAHTDRVETIDLVSRSISAYMRTLKSSRTAPYDEFVKINGLNAEPLVGEDSRSFARRALDHLSALEAKQSLKVTARFGTLELSGYKIFLTSTGARASGNCAVCHVPPLFTDFSFHNMGVSQTEYDLIHGAGSFARLAIPDAAEAQRPSAQFREIPDKQHEGWADLGFWNFVDLKSSPLRRKGETDDQLLRRTIGAFKTPTLRNLAYSYPYLHNGTITSIEGVVRELKRLSEMSRQGLIRDPDEELARTNITDSDVSSLTAFLRTLNEDFKRLPSN
jgi:cytochrome c peroxidase